MGGLFEYEMACVVDSQGSLHRIPSWVAENMVMYSLVSEGWTSEVKVWTWPCSPQKLRGRSCCLMFYLLLLAGDPLCSLARQGSLPLHMASSPVYLCL